MTAHDKLTIETPEHVALEFTLAGAGSRFLALAVDTVLQIVVLLAIALLFSAGAILRVSANTSAGTWVQAAGVLFGFVLYYGYFAIFEAAWSGQTPGKRLIGLRVISLTGRPITVFDAVLRNLLRIVDQMPGIYAVGIIAVAITRWSQRLGDLAAGTVVVVEQATRRAEPPAQGSTRGPGLGAARLTPKEIETIEAFLDRREALPLSIRDRSAGELARYVRERLGAPADGHAAPESLLEDVMAEYRESGRSR